MLLDLRTCEEAFGQEIKFKHILRYGFHVQGRKTIILRSVSNTRPYLRQGKEDDHSVEHMIGLLEFSSLQFGHGCKEMMEFYA